MLLVDSFDRVPETPPSYLSPTNIHPWQTNPVNPHLSPEGTFHENTRLPMVLQGFPAPSLVPIRHYSSSPSVPSPIPPPLKLFLSGCIGRAEAYSAVKSRQGEMKT